MLKRFGWPLLAIIALSSVVWFNQYYQIVKNPVNEPSEPASRVDSPMDTASASAEEITEHQIRQSARHAAQAVQKAARLKELRVAIQAQEDKVEERRKVLSLIVRSRGIIYRENDSNSATVGDEGTTASDLNLFHQLEAEKMQLESQMSSMLKYDNEQLMVYSVGLNLPDNTIRIAYPKYQEAKRKLEELKRAGLQSSNPQVIEKVREIEGLKQQLDEGVVSLRATLKAQLDMATERLLQQATKRLSPQAAATKDQSNSQDYVDAKRDFETDQKLLEVMKLKLIEEREKPAD